MYTLTSFRGDDTAGWDHTPNGGDLGVLLNTASSTSGKVVKRFTTSLLSGGFNRWLHG